MKLAYVLEPKEFVSEKNAQFEVFKTSCRFKRWLNIEKISKDSTQARFCFHCRNSEKRPIVSCNSAQVGSKFSAGEYLDVYLS